MPPVLDFIDQIIHEAEERKDAERVEMSKLRADDMLKVLSVLDSQMSDVNMLCDTEIARIEAYRQAELSRLDKKRSWITFNLDAYIRESGEKTIRLPSGTIKLRKGRDKIVIVGMETFLKAASRLGFLKSVPESFEPDQQKIMAYLKRTGFVPEGCEFIPAETRFSYTTTLEEKSDGANADETERQTETGAAA